MFNALRTSTTLLNSQTLAGRSTFSSFALGARVRAARSYATEAALPSTSTAHRSTSVGKGKTNGDSDGPLRPHLGVEVNPNHGLWAFFRKTVGKDGVQSYETVEKRDNAMHYSGRAWSAAELRRKSFKDLHTLWYVVLRERNLLETQLLEAKRLGAIPELVPVNQRMFRCRKTMARIKYVINERRLAYEGAVKIITEGNEDEVLARGERAAQLEGAPEKQTGVSEPGVGQAEGPSTVLHTAAERAAAGLVQPEVVRK